MTWSIIFHERNSGRIAIAVATKFFAVGARVPNIEPQKGAVCTQAMINPLYGPHGLRLIREGVGAADVVRILVTPDAGREQLNLLAIKVRRLNTLIERILTSPRAGRRRKDRTSGPLST
jgi:uncharacterized Ntn-hydrolase superfamily protein